MHSVHVHMHACVHCSTYVLVLFAVCFVFLLMIAKYFVLYDHVCIVLDCKNLFAFCHSPATSSLMTFDGSEKIDTVHVGRLTYKARRACGILQKKSTT